MSDWTIKKLLNWVTEHLEKKGIESARLNAELLICHVLGTERIKLYTDFNKAVTTEQLDKLRDLVKKSADNEPIAYLTGKTEFYSLQFDITKDCIIPRPETEMLVERAVEFLQDRTGKQLVCDLCTGCGCIAVAIAKNFSETEIVATDISDTALSSAAKNIEKYQLENRIKLLCGDLFDSLVPQLDTEKFDLIVCNPPYVSAAEYEALGRNVKDYEPKLGLFAGTDGLDVYRRICEKVDDFLKPDAALMLEIGYSQGPAVKELLERTGVFAEITIEKDFNNNDRIAIAKKKTNAENLLFT